MKSKSKKRNQKATPRQATAGDVVGTLLCTLLVTALMVVTGCNTVVIS